MDKTSLVGPDVAAGSGLLRDLDRGGVPVRSSFWLHLSDEDEWRLYIASPLVDESGPRAAYEVLMPYLQQHPTIPVSAVTVASPSSDLVNLIGVALRTDAHGTDPIRFKGNTINGVYLDDAFIYRST